MLPLLLERILCKNKNEQLIVSWTKVVFSANAKKGGVCVCTHECGLWSWKSPSWIPPQPSARDESASYLDML